MASSDASSVPQVDVRKAGRAQVRLSGAASVIDGLVGPHRAAVEQATGLEVIVERSTAGQGLKDLVEGRCDAALISASLEASLEAARAAGFGGAPTDLRMETAATSQVVFIVHPSNPVGRLSWEQLRDIHTGAIASWKQVGGRDLAVAVYTDAPASATRGLVKQVVLAGREYAASARAVASVKEVNAVVSRDEAGLGALGLEFAVPGEVRVIETKALERPLAFVTRGAPSDAVRRVVDAYRALGRK